MGLVLYLGAGYSALTYGLWGYALRHLEASQAGVFDNVLPVVGVAAGLLVLRERPIIWHLAGGALVIAGVWLTSRHVSSGALVSQARFRRKRLLATADVVQTASGAEDGSLWNQAAHPHDVWPRPLSSVLPE